MKFLIVYSHPNPESFNAALLHTARIAAGVQPHIDLLRWAEAMKS